MEDKKRKQGIENNVDQYTSVSDYGGMIIEIIHKMENIRFLKMAYGFIKSLYEEEKAGR